MKVWILTTSYMELQYLTSPSFQNSAKKQKVLRSQNIGHKIHVSHALYLIEPVKPLLGLFIHSLICLVVWFLNP